jgi:hypothetical protein
MEDIGGVVGTKQEKSAMRQLFQQMGGELSGYLGFDRNNLKKTVKDVMRDPVARERWKIVEHPIDALRGVVGFTESGPRLAEFESVMREKGYDPERVQQMMKEGKTPPLPVLVEAINAAHDVTTDFRRMGTWGRHLNKVIPYLNANMEAMDKMIRNGKAQPHRIAAYAASIAALTALYWRQVKDDDWYKEAPAWLKYGFWSFPDSNGKPLVRIPRPFEYGWLFAASTEAMLNQAYNDDPEAMEQWMEEGPFNLQNTVDKVIPTGLKPAIEVGADYDFFRQRPILNSTLEKLLPERQYYPNTTKTAIKLGEMTGNSPAKIEHLLNGYTGGWYRRAFRLAEGSLAGGEGLEARDIPFAGGLIVPGEQSRSLNEFYEVLDQVSREVRTAQAEGRELPQEKARLKRLNRIAKQMSSLRKQNQGLDREEYQKVQRKIIGLARKALEKEALERYSIP